ncbi:MAG: flagellar motor protein MotB [Bdellovibrionota bacterium]|nr:flagellar motor protein MotB [Bdellovibrionota bacterium]
MADEEEGEEAGGGGGEGEAEEQECPKCEECVPGLPGWMATFSDLVTLLLTFFVLLLSFAKTESAKFEAALGSVRNAFGGNVLKHGETIHRGKSPDNAPTMIESEQTVKPFPIDFLTMEGLLDKHEINRESDEVLNTMKKDLKEYSLSENVDIYELPEGIKVRIKDRVLFKKGSIKIQKIAIEVFDKLVQLLKNKDWNVFVEGHASPGEVSSDGKLDAFNLSSYRSAGVTRALVRRGVRPEKISSVFYGDTRPFNLVGESTPDELQSRRVEFLLRKTDLRTPGKKVDSQ